MTGRMAIGIAALLAGFTAVLVGLWGLFDTPIMSVLVFFGGLAVSICSAVELVFGEENGDDRNSSRRPRGGTFNLPA